ncbi:WXG100 family type VII secretion target [Nocardioides zeicaulis]|uniref:WXG100 family type VII secretion target n=1 Tax=Nocardioides zeicaulis TaxID=1776857 RepID=A0ABV6DZD0_9ACTN
MIISGTLVLDADGQAATRHDLGARLAELEERRDAAARTVAALVATWHGAAADRFEEQWQAWDEGAAGVLAALGRSLAALDLARAELLSTDGHRGQSAAALAGRLG